MNNLTVYLLNKPLYFVTFILSMVPLWFAVLFPIANEFDLITGGLFFLLIFASKVNVETELLDANPFSAMVTTLLKMSVSISIQVTIVVLLFILGIAILLQVKTAVVVVSIFILLAIMALFVFGRSITIQKLWGYYTIESRKAGFFSELWYQLIWVVILFTNDKITVMLGLILSFYFYMKHVSKRYGDLL